jgi:hypothetical protein
MVILRYRSIGHTALKVNTVCWRSKAHTALKINMGTVRLEVNTYCTRGQYGHSALEVNTYCGKRSKRAYYRSMWPYCPTGQYGHTVRISHTIHFKYEGTEPIRTC